MTDNIQLDDKIDQTLHDVEKTLVSIKTVGKETFEDIQGKLFEVYEQAVKAGDTKAAEAIENSWMQVQQLSNAVISSTDAAQTIADLAHELRDQRQQALKELEELSNAVENVDTEHPAVARLASMVEDDVREYISEMEGDMYDESYGEGRASVYEDIIWSLRNSGLSHNAIEAFTELFDGSMDLSQEHVELVKDFISKLIAIRPVSDKFGPGHEDNWDDEDGDDDE